MMKWREKKREFQRRRTRKNGVGEGGKGGKERWKIKSERWQEKKGEGEEEEDEERGGGGREEEEEVVNRK